MHAEASRREVGAIFAVRNRACADSPPRPPCFAESRECTWFHQEATLLHATRKLAYASNGSLWARPIVSGIVVAVPDVPPRDLADEVTPASGGDPAHRIFRALHSAQPSARILVSYGSASFCPTPGCELSFPPASTRGRGAWNRGVDVRDREAFLSLGLLTAIQKLIILVVPNRPSSTDSGGVQPHDGPGDVPTGSSNLQLRVAGSAPGPSQRWRTG
jgi:hypothetical protein